MVPGYSISFNPARCVKCYACEIACLQWRGIQAGTVKLRKVVEITEGTFPEVRRSFYSFSCRHCADPLCLEACPSGAITRRPDGIVVVNAEKCSGCRSCLEACVYGVPQFGEDGRMQKCDLCLDRLEKGQRPFCVETCPTQALRWGREDENA